MRVKSSQIVWIVAVALLAVACDRPEPLTESKANEIIGRYSFKAEPVYAEVPQRVWWSPSSPKDDYDEKALRTLHNLEKAGLVTIEESTKPDGTVSYLAHTTEKGFPILGTAPSMRGPVFRGRICEKRYDGLKGFQRHPSQPTIGSANLMWHYTNPTWLYPLFETKINKPLDKPFASQVAFRYEDHEWKFNVVARKVDG